LGFATIQNYILENKCSDKENSFIDHYIIDLNGTEAVRRSEYDTKHHAQLAAQILSRQHVKDEIAKRRKEMADNTGLDPDWVLRKAQILHDRCMGIEPVLIFDGENWIESGEFKFDGGGANKALDTIAKIVGAFEKDNSQKPTSQTIINLGAGTKPDDPTPETE